MPVPRLLVAWLAPIVLAAMPSGTAEALFIAPWDGGQWRLELRGVPPGGGGTGSLPQLTELSLQGGDGFCNSFPSEHCLVIVQIDAPEAATVRFAWHYETTDRDGPSFDRFGYTEGESFGQLSTDGPPPTGPGAPTRCDDRVDPGCIQDGFASVDVTRNTPFGFAIDCTDCRLGPASVTISNFEVTPVPEPTSLLLVGSSMAGVGLARWRQRRRKQPQP
jgi:PEP-CTERM motif-containing protein